MNEPPERAPRPTWEERMAFRELFLLHAPPRAAVALRELAREMYHALIESGLPEPGEPRVRARVRALAEDLRFSAQALASLGDARLQAGLTPNELTLSLQAESWAREVAELVQILDAALGAAGEGS